MKKTFGNRQPLPPPLLFAAVALVAVTAEPWRGFPSRTRQAAEPAHGC